MKEERLSYCIAPDFIEDEVDVTVLSNADEDYQQMVAFHAFRVDAAIFQSRKEILHLLSCFPPDLTQNEKQKMTSSDSVSSKGNDIPNLESKNLQTS